ncbi:MAG: DUF177 domain-containing protein [Flavobacteriales bacterium]|nr:DUF177 domain-containing protein [Flavobacteriales bacterium]
MRGTSEYEIPYTGLGIGRHAFGFQLDGAFFSDFNPSGFDDAEISAETELDRFESMMHFDVHVTGTVRSSCDRCNAPVTCSIDHRVRYVVKFGDHTHRNDDDILVLGPAEHVLDVREFLYESTVLGLPLRRVHESEEDCDPKVLQWLTGSVDHAPEEVEEATDPRWAALKGLSSSDDQNEEQENEEE